MQHLELTYPALMQCVVDATAAEYSAVRFFLAHHPGCDTTLLTELVLFISNYLKTVARLGRLAAAHDCTFKAFVRSIEASICSCQAVR